MLLVGIYIIFRWPFDPPTKFEKRRLRMAKELAKLMDDCNPKERQNSIDSGSMNPQMIELAKQGPYQEPLPTDAYRETDDILKDMDQMRPPPSHRELFKFNQDLAPPT